MLGRRPDKLRSAWLVFVFVASSFSHLTSCAAEPQPLIVGFNAWPGYMPLVLAGESFEPNEIKLVPFPSATHVMRSLKNNVIDAAALTLDEALSVASEGTPIRVVDVLDVSHGGDVVMTREPISAITALKGKRIGVETSAVGLYMLTRVLERANLARTDVDVVPMMVTELEAAWTTNRIDAAVTFSPTKEALAALGGHVVFSSREIPGEIVDVLAVRESVGESKHQQLRILVEAERASCRSFVTDIPTNRDAISRILMAPIDDVDGMFENITFPCGSFARDELTTAIERLTTWMHAEDILGRTPVHADGIVRGLEP